MKNVLLLALGIIIFRTEVFASEPAAIKDERDRTGYSLGYQIGEDLVKQKTPLDPDAFLQGLEDGLSGGKPKFSDDEMLSTLAALKREIMAQDQTKQAERQAKRRADKEKNWAENRDFLAANAKKEGVVTLPSGLQYMVLKEGTGKRPGLHDTVVANYLGTLIDGTEFGNTFRQGKPERRRVDAMIPGMKEALQLMREGARWRLFIPGELAYGERGPLADRAVIIEIELISVESSG